jgi:hypothetical protein
MAGGSAGRMNKGTYSSKGSGMPGAKVSRGPSGKATADKKMKATYDSKKAGMPGAKVDRGC